MNRKLVILVVGVVAVVAILAVLLVPLLLAPVAPVGPPFGVYARPTPLISETPFALFPGQVAGFNLMRAEQTPLPEGGESAFGSYEGEITIGIQRWSSSGAAASLLDLNISNAKDAADLASASADEQHWIAATWGAFSMFVWRKDVWVFSVFAPDAALRNQVVQELAF